MAKHFNLEPKSFNYLALYDADHEKIMENFKVIAETSKEIILELNSNYQYLPKSTKLVAKARIN